MRVLLVDFWSDGNIGDAVMQKEIIEQVAQFSEDIHIISCFGKNQFQLNAFNESLAYDNLTWHPAYFSTYIKLDFFSEYFFGSRIKRLLKTLFGLLFADLRLILYRIFKFRFLLGSFSFLVETNYDAIVFNGRNYRDFGSKLKNYINNRPLTIHQELILITSGNVPCINAGFSAWKLDASTTRFIKKFWPKIGLHVARESFSYSYFQSKVVKEINQLNVKKYKDLSFDFLSNKMVSSKKKKDVIAFSITRVKNIDFYIQLLNQILSFYVDRHYEVVYVEQVYLIHENVDDLLDKITVPYKEFRSKNISKLLECYSECKYVLSSRMHGSIMALSQGCEVASLAYDDGAKWSILTDEMSDYPIFSPMSSKCEEIINYFGSLNAKEHVKCFANILKTTNEKYIEKFLRNIDP